MAHTHLLGAHLGMDKTRERVLARFYWPGVKRDVERHCQGCPECQRVAPRANARHPLIPMPIIETPFERLALDIVGPLPKTSRGHRYILVVDLTLVVDYATRYPEALPLRAATAKAVARELMLLFSRVGIAKEVLTDQGSCFMSRVMKEVLSLLQVKQLRTSVYHPQTDGLVERFNKTLKQMLKKVMQADGKNWDQLLPHVLFAVREVPQASTGFSPFELLYGRRPHGILDITKEAWESQPSPHRTTVDHVEQVRDRMARVWPIVRGHLQQAQQAQARVYNRGAQPRTFQPGELVLVLVPTAECRFLAKWQGPYEVVERVGEVNYRVRQPGRRKPTQLYHINLLKQWRGGEQTPADPAPLSLAARQEIPEVPVGEDLSPAQRHDLDDIILQHRDVFSDLPGRTAATHHDIRTAPGIRVRVPPYRIPEARREAIRTEVRRMLQLGVIEESRSAWCSPVVLVPKPDGTFRFCNDFRRLNEASEFDAYLISRVDELIERLGPARYLSTLDLTKGYWQVPLTRAAREKTAFSTPGGLYQYTVLPFGVHGTPATFQRMMDQLLRPHQDYAAAYIDDIIIYSPSWDIHVRQLRAVLGELRKAGLTANPAKCRLGREETTYLGYRVGRGTVRPQEGKVAAIRAWPQPRTKKQVKAFLGLVGYYQRFIPGYATLASPMNDLTRKALPDRVTWSEAADRAFKTLREALCSEPVLITPDFNLPVIVHTDASEVGLGGVLSQVRAGEEHPITYVSRKLLPNERNYSTVEKEALAIKWCLEKLRYYLLGREFTLVTDHDPLKWMAGAKNTNARVTRWFLALQDFRFRVDHRPGREHANADALSRRDACLGGFPRDQGLEQTGGGVWHPAPEASA
uniref:Gypsy retrotransposon integrase-like protein 1 n=1 Tax=Gadus morhua TaxID=8049 RepID=A0A8C5C6I6_GADMO